MSTTCLAVIPARGGSKGLPGKNVRPLAGMPLLVHSLMCAQLAPQITRTIVSTDSDEIASLARAHGADVPFLRPADLARDDSPMLSVLKHALAEIERAEGRTYSTVLLLDPTSPGRTPADIARAFEILQADQHADGVIACSRPTFNPFWVGVTADSAGYLQSAFPQARSFTRRQDVPAFYRINGAIYLWQREFLVSATSTLDGRQLMIEIPEIRALSIDDLTDFEHAEALLDKGLIQFPWLAR